MLPRFTISDLVIEARSVARQDTREGGRTYNDPERIIARDEGDAAIRLAVLIDEALKQH